jgi:uncharacterized protein YqgC (DUF456 family)
MTTEQVIGLTLSLLVMGSALLGSILHVLPGAALIFLAALGHRLYFGPTGVSTWVLVVLAGVALLAMLMDILASVIGARRLGATRRGMCGAVAGGLVGLLFSLPGLVLGPFLGAFLLESWGGRPVKQAAKAGLGAGLGLLVGTLANFACCSVMIALFAASVLVNSLANRPAETMTRMGDTTRVRAAHLYESSRPRQSPVLSHAGPYVVRNAEHRPGQHFSQFSS